MMNQNTPPPLRRLRGATTGWCLANQEFFLDALARGLPVRDACREVGLSWASVYKLRRKPGAENFRRAWDAAAAVSLDMAEWGPGGRRYLPLTEATTAQDHTPPRVTFY